jgi:hypothetical protein
MTVNTGTNGLSVVNQARRYRLERAWKFFMAGITQVCGRDVRSNRLANGIGTIVTTNAIADKIGVIRHVSGIKPTIGIMANIALFSGRDMIRTFTTSDHAIMTTGTDAFGLSMIHRAGR